MNNHSRDARLTGLSYSLLGLIFSVLWALSLQGMLPQTLGVVIILPLLAYVPFEIIARTDKENTSVRSMVIRCVAGLLVAMLLCGFIIGFISFRVYIPAENYTTSFLANSGLPLFYSTLLLIWMLSSLQKDIFWLFPKKIACFDERELRQRQEIFELSYRIGALILPLLGIALTLKVEHITNSLVGSPQNVALGSFFGIIFTFILAMYALPLLIAAWKIKQ